MSAHPGKSLGLSLQSIYETLAISFPTVVDALRGRVSFQVCNDRLAGWSQKVIRHAKIDLTVEGREQLAKGATFLVMSNHQSHYDIPVLFYVMGGNIRMITKEELFSLPIFGKAIREAGFISIDRRNRNAAIRSLNEARDLLARGTHVWIAPEGTRSRTGELGPFKKGAFYLALEALLPILPVTIKGTRDTLPAQGIRSRPGAHVEVILHPPIDPTPFAANKKEGRKELMDLVKRTLESAL